jgi:hypothetical protein
MVSSQLPNPCPWDVIFGDESGHTVLAIDFPVQHRREAGFAELAVKLGSSYRFLHSQPPAVRACQKVSSVAYVDPWIEYLQQEKFQVRAVLGYGVGSVYAAAVADGISRWQPAPEIILFDPRFPSIGLLGHEFNREISASSSLLSDEEIERSKMIAAQIAESVARDVADAAVEIVESYLEVVSVAFERAGLGVARGSALTAPFEAYMSWVSVADQIDPSFAWRRSVAIVSSDHARPPHREPVNGGGDNLIGRWIPVEVRRADLLRCDSVATMVANLLGSGNHD